MSGLSVIQDILEDFLDDNLSVLSGKVCNTAKQIAKRYIKQNKCKSVEDVKDPLMKELIKQIEKLDEFLDKNRSEA